jgi:hypothetical protein
VPDVSAAHALDGPDGQLARLLDLTPEGLLVEVVPVRVPRDAVVARLLAQKSARLALAGERTVEAAERLDPDEVAQHEHVERNLQLLLRRDLRRGMTALAGLVVLHDPARAEWIDVDPVDLSGEGHAGGELEPALQLGRGALRPERHLEAPGNERRLRLGVLAHERLQVAPEAVAKLALLQLGQLHPHAVDRLVEAAA